jgi:hypothetical protein
MLIGKQDQQTLAKMTLHNLACVNYIELLDFIERGDSSET